MQKEIIIDGHAHIYSETIAHKVIDSFTDLHNMHPTNSVGKGTVSDILQCMNTNNITYTIMANFAPAKSINTSNEWTLLTGEQNPGLIPLISVYPDMPLDIVQQYFSKGAKGIKMHTGIQGFEPTDKGLSSIYDYCEKNRIPITFHCWETSRVHLNEYAEMSHILPVLKAYPRIPFVLTHLAGGKPEEVLEIAEQYPNAYFDTSITMTGEHCIDRIHDDFWENDDNTVKAFRTIGCTRITFGSDYPFGNPRSDIQRIRSLSLTDSEKQQILGLNTYKLYFKEDYNNADSQ